MSTTASEARAGGPFLGLTPLASDEWWSGKRDAKLRKLRAEGVSTRDIANALRCSQGSVARRCKRLGVPLSPLVELHGAAVAGAARAARSYVRDGVKITAGWDGSTRPASRRKQRAPVQPEKKAAPSPKPKKEAGPRTGWWYGRNKGPEPRAVTERKIAVRANTLGALPSAAPVVLEQFAPVPQAPVVTAPPRIGDNAACRWPMWGARPSDRCNPEYCCKPRAPAFVHTGRTVYTPYCDEHSRLAYPGYPRST